MKKLLPHHYFVVLGFVFLAVGISLFVVPRQSINHSPNPLAILPVRFSADEILGPNALFPVEFYYQPNLLVEYTDFNSADSRTLYQYVPAIGEKFGPLPPRLPRLSVVLIPYPLSGTAEPGSPCVAAVAADMQGRLPDMESALYSYIGPEAQEDTSQMAARLYLDVPRFKRDCKGAALQVVLQNIAQGRRLGVHATPTLFFIMPQGTIVQPASIHALEQYSVAAPPGID